MRDYVCVYQTKAGCLEMRMIERRLAGAVRPGERNQDRPTIEEREQTLPLFSGALCRVAHALKLTVHESADAARAVLFDPLQ